MPKTTGRPPKAKKTESDVIYHIVDFHNRYPGEDVTFQTTLKIHTHQEMRTVSVHLPPGVQLVDATLPDGERVKSSAARDSAEGAIVDWILDSGLNPGDSLSFTTLGKVLPMEYELPRRSRAVLRDGQGYEICSETVEMMVRSQSQLIKYLPEIYHDSDFLGRFLMLFESFLSPISLQIAQSDHYFDPNLAPEGFLPWLASWIGVTWDDSLPVSRRRLLLNSALELYQKRGTQAALHDYLKIYSGGEVEIREHRAQNFALGSGFQLGSSIALGKTNQPHTFNVKLWVKKPDLLERFGKEQANVEELFRKKIETIIDAQKPAHTAFGLEVNIVE